MRETPPTDQLSPPQYLLERLKDYGQEHMFGLWSDLSAHEKLSLVADIESVDIPRTDRIIRSSLSSPVITPSFDHVPDSFIATVDSRRPEDKDRWWKQGLKAIADGKLAVVLLAGGLGTRLGSLDPKGCFNIGLPSGKSLFQLFAERIVCLQRLCGGQTQMIHVYVMTSPFTDEVTRKFFEAHRLFGLDSDQITFFRQGTIPCVSRDGRFVMETPWKVAKSPDGNGGVYAALRAAELLDDMALRGVKYVDFSGVDNALAKVADPAFLGYLIDKGSTAAAKVVRKTYPQENVGVFVRRGKGLGSVGPLAVVEYSELDTGTASAIDQETGRLRYRWGNACHHIFTLEFLNHVAVGLEKDALYHLVGGGNGGFGLKLERFVFDAFPYAPSVALYEVTREEEFAPVKNANGGAFDTPESARLMVLRLHSRWVVSAGGFLTHSVPLYATGVEVSPICSYAGENLEAICRGRTFHAPCEITF